ncbi:TIGR02996 domain-containing protein [Gemmata sp. JC673]|uniref:TIGR02996 domain-containing protein n=1 Tax=Gemmata algarum TaxID=2975278 RepID=A0ABU5F6Q2_9BACT|nr:TIGR02996 domain-containing protein [Gemmata algarum]MDY3563169.1 TIGR02996 domain-containing protein [Gemmata algarum]
MRKHPDADAFVREHLRHPTNATTRLAFADWLDETGMPSNAAWAQYIRLREEADRHAPDSDEQQRLLRQADGSATKVRAKLTLAALIFARDPESILQLIPAANVTVRLDNFAVPTDVLQQVPESVARENLTIPLAAVKETLFCANAAPHHVDTAHKLSFILNRNVVLVRAKQNKIVSALNSGFGGCNIDYFDSQPLFVSFTDIAGGFYALPLHTVAGPDPAFIESIIVQGLRMGATQVRVFPEGHHVAIAYQTGERWSYHDPLPARFWPAIAEVVAREAQMSLAETFADRIAAYGGTTGSFSFLVARTRYVIGVTIRLGSVDPRLTLDLQPAPSID